MTVVDFVVGTILHSLQHVKGRSEGDALTHGDSAVQIRHDLGGIIRSVGRIQADVFQLLLRIGIIEAGACYAHFSQ